MLTAFPVFVLPYWRCSFLSFLASRSLAALSCQKPQCVSPLSVHYMLKHNSSDRGRYKCATAAPTHLGQLLLLKSMLCCRVDVTAAEPECSRRLRNKHTCC